MPRQTNCFPVGFLDIDDLLHRWGDLITLHQQSETTSNNSFWNNHLLDNKGRDIWDHTIPQKISTKSFTHRKEANWVKLGETTQSEEIRVARNVSSDPKDNLSILQVIGFQLYPRGKTYAKKKGEDADTIRDIKTHLNHDGVYKNPAGIPGQQDICARDQLTRESTYQVPWRCEDCIQCEGRACTHCSTLWQRLATSRTRYMGSRQQGSPWSNTVNVRAAGSRA